jgi:DNA-binding beta-propeller fold protein YncE
LTGGPELFIGSAGDGRVKRFHPATGVFFGDLVSVGGIPEGMVVDANGFLYLAVDTDGGGAIQRVNLSTGAVNQFNQGGDLASPDGLTFGPGGDLFVADGVRGDVRRFDGTTGAFEGIFATGGFDLRGLIFGPGGDLFVTQGLNNRVLRFDGATGASKGTFASGGGVDYAHGLAFGPTGDLFVASTTNDRVIRFDGVTGASKGTFSQNSALDGPTGLVFGPEGDLFVSSYQSDRIVRFDGVSGAFEAVAAQGNGLHGPVYLIAVPEPCGLLVAVGMLASALRRTTRPVQGRVFPPNRHSPHRTRPEVPAWMRANRTLTLFCSFYPPPVVV